MRKIERLEAELHSYGVDTVRAKVQNSYFLIVVIPTTLDDSDKRFSRLTQKTYDVIKRYYPRAAGWRVARPFHELSVEAAAERLGAAIVADDLDKWRQIVDGQRPPLVWCIYE